MKQLFLSIIYLCLFSLNAQKDIVIYFDFNSNALTSQSKSTLGAIDLTTIDILGFYGYTDTVGSLDYNYALATRRVEEACAFMNIKNPISTEKAIIGELFAPNTLDKENRKVVIQISEKDHNVSLLEEKLKEAKIGDNIILKSLNFEPGLSILLTTSLPSLNELYSQMIKNKNLIIEIQGHICCASSDELDLSTARAKSVYDFLISKGISKNRMTYIGLGVTSPLYTIPEKNEMEEKANRRVEIKIISN